MKQPEGSEKQAVKVAVGKLISEFQTPIIDDNQVFLLTSLRKRFLELLKEEGLEDMPTNTVQIDLRSN